MIKSSVEKLSETIGFEIGLSDDITQSNLLNGFCKGLSNSMDTGNLPIQLCAIVDKLDSKSHTILRDLVSYIALKERR